MVWNGQGGSIPETEKEMLNGIVAVMPILYILAVTILELMLVVIHVVWSGIVANTWDQTTIMQNGIVKITETR